MRSLCSVVQSGLTPRADILRAYKGGILGTKAGNAVGPLVGYECRSILEVISSVIGKPLAVWGPSGLTWPECCRGRPSLQKRVGWWGWGDCKQHCRVSGLETGKGFRG